MWIINYIFTKISINKRAHKHAYRYSITHVITLNNITSPNNFFLD